MTNMVNTSMKNGAGWVCSIQCVARIMVLWNVQQIWTDCEMTRQVKEDMGKRADASAAFSCAQERT